MSRLDDVHLASQEPVEIQQLRKERQDAKALVRTLSAEARRVDRHTYHQESTAGLPQGPMTLRIQSTPHDRSLQVTACLTVTDLELSQYRGQPDEIIRVLAEDLSRRLVQELQRQSSPSTYRLGVL